MVQAYTPEQVLVRREPGPSYFGFRDGDLSGSATSYSLRRSTGLMPIDLHVAYAHGERASPWSVGQQRRPISCIIESHSLSTVGLITEPARKRPLAEI